MSADATPEGTGHSGFVAVLGRPNVGKSTFLNTVMGLKLAITSNKPQTTRNRVTGVVNRGRCQIIFIDTPGIHESTRAMNRMMNREALSTLADADAVLFMVDGVKGITDEDREIAEKMKTAGVPVLIVANKMDRGANGREHFAGLGLHYPIYEISSLTGKGTEELLEAVAGLMPEGPVYFPDEELTDRSERFIAQEFIREKIYAFTGEEIPYHTAVTVESWEEKPDKNLVVIHATIHVERQSQKQIIIGKGGSLVKKIGRTAREDLEKLLGVRIYLDLHVGVEPNWTKDKKKLARFGLDGG